MLRWTVGIAVAMGCTHAPPATTTPPPPPPRVVEAPPPPPPPPPLDRDPPRLVDGLLAMFTDIPPALAGPCADIKTALAAVADRHAEVIAANAKVEREGRVGELRAAVDARKDKLVAVGNEITTALARVTCTNDPDFTAALDKVLRP